MYCNRCGHALTGTPDFCHHCGAPLAPGDRPSRSQELPAPRRDDPSLAPRPRRRASPSLEGRGPDARFSHRQPSDPRYAPDGAQPGPQAPPYGPADVPAALRRPRELWINRDDPLGALMRHLHGQDTRRWKLLTIAAAVAAGLSLLLPWYTLSFLRQFDFFDLFGDGIRSSDWLVISLACTAIVASLSLNHPMYGLVGCAFVDYFALSNLTSLLWTSGFMTPSLGFFLYLAAATVATYGCLASGALEEINLALPSTTQSGPYPSPSNPRIPRGDSFDSF